MFQQSSRDLNFGALIKTNGSITIKSLSNPPLMAKDLSNNPFVQRISSKETYEEITSCHRKLKDPSILNAGRRTWIERSGKTFISVFYLSLHHAGYCNLVHGGVLAALIDHVSAEYCNYAAPGRYALTKCLEVEFTRPSPPGALFLARVSTSREVPFDLDTKKVWIECEIWTAPVDDKFAMVVKAKALFVLRESLPKLSSSEAKHSIEELLLRK